MKNIKTTRVLSIVVILSFTGALALPLISVNRTPVLFNAEQLSAETEINQPENLILDSDTNSVNQQNNDIVSSNHPLTRNETVLLALDEFGVIPPAIPPPAFGVIYDDASTNFNPLVFGFEINTNTYTVVTGDFDGDGNDEILVADGGLVFCNVSLYDYENGVLKITWTQLVFVTYYSQQDALGWVAITAGDFDADGIDEFAMLLSGRTDIGDTYINWVFLWAYDIQENKELGFKNVYEIIGEEDVFRRDFLDIEAGDFDGDGADEIVFVLAVWARHLYIKITHSWTYIPLLCRMSVLDDSRSSFTSLGNESYIADINEELVYLAPQLEVGNFDHDPFEEIALLVLPAMEDSYLSYALTEVWIFDYEKLMFLQFPTATITDTNVISEQYLSPRTLLAVDVDGDNQQELAVFGLDIYSLPVFMVLDHNESSSDPEEAYYVSKDSYGTEDAGFVHGGNIFDPLLSQRAYAASADVDCDGKEEIIFTDYLGTTVLDDASANYSILFYYLITGPLFSGNFDGDGIRVRYTGNTWETQSPPGIIAVLAAPPTQYGIEQNYASSYTAYGKEISGEETEGNSIGHSSSTSISFDLEIGFFGFKGLEMGWSQTWAKEHVKTGFKTKIEQRSAMYATGSDHDVVVYHVTTYHSYEYEIINHPSDSSLNGAIMSLNVPISSTIHHESIPYFNEIYKDKAPYIGNETLKHTIGMPWTYPSLADLGEVAPISWRSETQTIGQGSGWLQVKIDVTEQTGKTMTVTKSSEYSNKNSMFGLGFGHTSESITGSLYEIIIGRSCIYEGVVGDIVDPDLYHQLKYDFGLAVYYMTHPDGPSYQVINYWVENAVEYYPDVTSTSSATSSALIFGLDLLAIFFGNLLLIANGKRFCKRKL